MKVVLVAAGGQWPPPADCRDPMLEPNFSRARPGTSPAACDVDYWLPVVLLALCWCCLCCWHHPAVGPPLDHTTVAHCALSSVHCSAVLSSRVLGGLAPYLRACTERAVLARAGRWRCPAPLTLSFSPRSSCCCWPLVAGPGSPPHWPDSDLTSPGLGLKWWSAMRWVLVSPPWCGRGVAGVVAAK